MDILTVLIILLIVFAAGVIAGAVGLIGLMIWVAGDLPPRLDNLLMNDIQE